MNAIAQVIFSIGFGILYWELSMGPAGAGVAPVWGIIAALAYALAFFLPQALFRFNLKDNAGQVLAQLSRRFAVAAAITLLLNIAIAAQWLPNLEKPVPVAMELYSATLLGLIVFHGLGGLMAEQANYLQRTAQYKSDQLLAVVVALCVLFVLLLMYFLAFDLGIAREPRIYIRDMVFGTLAFAGFGFFIYRLAHH